MQSGRRWYQQLVQIMVDSLGFIQCEVHQAVFFKPELNGNLMEHVEITVLGELHWLLGIEVKREKESHTISLLQRSYIESIIHRFGFENSKPISTPMNPNSKISIAQSPSTGAQYAVVRNVPYHEAVGALMYTMLGTCPDISFTVTIVSKFSSNPGIAHWETMK